MRLANAEYNNQAGLALVDGEQLIFVEEFLNFSNGNQVTYDPMVQLIAEGDPVLSSLKDLSTAHGNWIPIEDVQLNAPIQFPPKNIMCVGQNYQEHVDEGYKATGDKQRYDAPVFFTKPHTALIGPSDNVIKHENVRYLDYEVELGLVIGRKGRNIRETDAWDYIFGYTIINDVTARGLQKQHDNFFKGKGLDTFCPMGPWIVTADEYDDPQDKDISMTVNSEIRQDSNTQHMIFTIPEIIEWLSAGLTLEPGDVIATGTCAGCAFGMEPPKWLEPGQEMVAEIEGVGSISNSIVEG